LPLGSENGAGRVLMGRCDQHRASIESTKPIDAEAFFIDGNARRLQPALPNVGALICVAWILHGNSAHAAFVEHATQQTDALGGSATEHYAIRSSHGCTRTIQVRRDRSTSRLGTARVGIIERSM
jgi:hypothetical protein